MEGPEARIKARAGDLGFDLVGIAFADPGEAGPRLEEWLNLGFHGSMAWMARTAAKRRNPDLVLPGARSVICLGMNYHHPDASATPPRLGRVSQYAQGRDYHDVVGERLKKFAAWLAAEFPAERHLWYVDTGPVMEKALAAQAGLGWIGKHTNLINPAVGSWLFLGEVVTTLALSPDAPLADACGTCRRCIDACPTQAITEPYVLDARRCISYLTIEERGAIAEDLRSEMGEWMYGCDICQQVCPWNEKFARPSHHADLAPREEWAGLNPAAVLEMDEDQFKTMFRGSPMTRPKRSGMARNAAVVLGNALSAGGVGDPEAVRAVLTRSAADPDPVVADAARWALAQRGPKALR